MAHEIVYAPEAVEQISAFSKRDQQRLLDAVDRQLVHQPAQPTRHRKRLRPNLLADWELRVGDFRVYYLVSASPRPMVWVVAIGEKVGNRLFIAGEEVFI